MALLELRTYFITFGTYGARLHGDERGTVDGWHRRVGEPLIPSRPGLEAYERGVMKSEPVLLDASKRGVVEDAIRERCDVMGWRLWALNVRTNHVHVVVGSPSEPEKVMNSFKAWATRALRARSLVDAESRVWARHGSRRLSTEQDLEEVMFYVTERQGPDLLRE